MISKSPYSQRKLDFLRHFEAAGDELDRPGKFNAAYREDDRKFMRFLIPPGKRVLELGCGRGELLAALKPSYGVGVDFSATAIGKATERHPDLHFVLGDVEDPALAGIEGPLALAPMGLELLFPFGQYEIERDRIDPNLYPLHCLRDFDSCTTRDMSKRSLLPLGSARADCKARFIH
jgi:SAM-dependent methyltransferase